MKRRDWRRRDWRPLLLVTLLATPMAPRPAAAEDDPPKLLGQCTAAQLAAEPYAQWFEPANSGYTPNPTVVEALRRVDFEGVTVDVFFGTWCSDSRREVPRMLELLAVLGFPETDLRLIAVDNSDELHKRSPGGEEAGLEIYRVPTFVVKRGGEEVARIVEHPALSLERDLLAILEGRDYQPSYATYPVIRRWLREGLLADPNVNADGLASQIRALVSSEWELRSVARVFLSRGDVAEAAEISEVNCALYWESATCHTHLAEAQLRAGDREGARESIQRALERNDDPDRVEELMELLERARIDATGARGGP